MRVLFNNEVVGSTLTATNEDANYLVSNINHVFLKKIFKATDTSTVILSAFDTDRVIDSCYIGFTNATLATLRLYNSADTLLHTSVIDISRGGGAFARVGGVRYATVTLAAASNVYVGTIAIGETYEMPKPDNNVIKGHVDNSLLYQSSDGQSAINKIEWLRNINLSFTIIGIDLYNEIYGMFANVTRPIWIDIYDELTDGINPVYGMATFKEDSQSNHRYTFKLQCTEAR